MNAVDQAIAAVHTLATRTQTGSLDLSAVRCRLLAAADQLHAHDPDHPAAPLLADCITAVDQHGANRRRLAQALADAVDRTELLT